MHWKFRINLIKVVKMANPQLRAAEFRAQIKALFLQAAELEYRYAEDTMPRGLLGLTAQMFESWLRFNANCRATQIGLDPMFAQEENPFLWMSEMIELKKSVIFSRPGSSSIKPAPHQLGMSIWRCKQKTVSKRSLGTALKQKWKVITRFNGQ